MAGARAVFRIFGGEERRATGEDGRVRDEQQSLGLIMKHDGVQKIQEEFIKVKTGTRKILTLSKVDGLSTLPYELFYELREVSLQEAILAWNGIQVIPKSVLKIPCFLNLRSLSFFGNQLSFLPVTISELVNLEELLLDSNRLCAIPYVLGELPQLQVLGLSWNKINVLDGITLGKLQNLKSLDLVGNELCVLPESIGNLHSLETLRLSHNRLEYLPESFTKLVNLSDLHLADNCLKSLPMHMERLAKISQMDLHHNELHGDHLFNLFLIEQAHVVDIGNNRLVKLPELVESDVDPEVLQSRLASRKNSDSREKRKSGEKSKSKVPDEEGKKGRSGRRRRKDCVLKPLQWCRIFRIQYNHLVTLKSSIWSLLGSLRTLQLSFNRLTIDSFPSDFGKTLPHLEQLYLQSNRLTCLPQGLKNLERLRIVDLSRNEIDGKNGLFDILSSLPSLSDLDLSSNRLTSISPKLKNNQALCILALSNNKISALPNELGEIKAFHKSEHNFYQCHLKLSYNCFDSFPSCVFAMTGLKSLYLSGNDISKIPKKIAKLTMLSTLTVANNSTSLSLPKELTGLENLNRLYIRGTPIVGEIPPLPQINDFTISICDPLNTSDPQSANGGNVKKRLVGDFINPFVTNRQSKHSTFGVSKQMGGRKKNEDTFAIVPSFIEVDGMMFDYFAVFDGHGGGVVSELSQKFYHEELWNMLKEVDRKHWRSVLCSVSHHFNHILRCRLEQMDTKNEFEQTVPRSLRIGATCVVALVSDETLYISNAGDSRALFCYQGCAIRVSHDHSVGEWDETVRVRNLGGMVLTDQLSGGAYRIHDSPTSGVAVSRSLGDFQSSPFVTAEPFTRRYSINKLKKSIVDSKTMLRKSSKIRHSVSGKSEKPLTRLESGVHLERNIDSSREEDLEENSEVDDMYDESFDSDDCSFAPGVQISVSTNEKANAVDLLASLSSDEEQTMKDSLKQSFIILACDGVFDVLSDQEVANAVYKYPNDPERAAVYIQELAELYRSTDDICVVVVKLGAGDPTTASKEFHPLISEPSSPSSIPSAAAVHVTSS